MIKMKIIDRTFVHPPIGFHTDSSPNLAGIKATMSFDEEATMQVKIKRCILGCAFSVSLVVTGCKTVQTTRGGEAGVDRPQQMSVFTPSAAEVDATARQQYLQVTQAADRKRALNRDPMQTKRVRHIV